MISDIRFLIFPEKQKSFNRPISPPTFAHMDEQKINNWAKATQQKLLFQLARMDIRETGTLMQSLRSRTRTDRNGLPKRVQFSFERQGIFTAIGVGRGTKYGETNSNRKKKEWYQPVLRSEQPALADLWVELYADLIMRETPQL